MFFSNHQILEAKFSDFTRDLLGNEFRITAVGSKSLHLVDEGIADEKEILHKCHQVEELWEQLKEVTNVRTEVS